ncbi:hypothetical protein SVXHr_1996 [Halorhabdus sp. SVX81]|nr:hypothetical protein SVXHr_1996 [Halorhabdus sp. SVX81]
MAGDRPFNGRRARLQDERDDRQDDEDDDQPLGDVHADSGDSPGADDCRDDGEEQKQDRPPNSVLFPSRSTTCERGWPTK